MSSGVKPLPFSRLHHHAWPDKKMANRMLRKLPRNKTQRSLKMVLTWFVCFLRISAACCQLEDVLLQNLKNTWNHLFEWLLWTTTKFYSIHDTLTAEWYRPMQSTKERTSSSADTFWGLVLASLDLSPSSDDSSLANCITPNALVDFLKLHAPLQCTKLSLLGRTEVDTTKHGMLGMRDCFTGETRSSKSFSARKVGRNSSSHSMVFTLHGLLFMQFPRFGAHAQELWPWCPPDMFHITTPWSFQLWCGACTYSLGQWNWPSTSLITL